MRPERDEGLLEEARRDRRASTTSDGFLRTGDVGYMDADGFLYIVDRTKDMILCGGYNVYPRMIEEAIYEHPAVDEVMRDRHPRRLPRPVAQGLRQAEARRRAASRSTSCRHS